MKQIGAWVLAGLVALIWVCHWVYELVRVALGLNR